MIYTIHSYKVKPCNYYSSSYVAITLSTCCIILVTVVRIQALKGDRLQIPSFHYYRSWTSGQGSGPQILVCQMQEAKV